MKITARTAKPITAAQRRHRLLGILRRQAKLIGYGRFDQAAAPELHALAVSASNARGKSVWFCGVRFPLQFGWWKYVVDPETGQILVGTNGGLL